ncbi:hypothetical protein ACHAWF_014434 [Thalassiosira exigua]
MMAAFVVAAVALAALPFDRAAGFTIPLATTVGLLRRGTATVESHRMTRTSATSIMTSPASSWGSPPYLAVLTEPDACASLERVEQTIKAIDEATVDGGVDLVVLRVADRGSEAELLKWALLKNLSEMRQQRRFSLVVNGDVEIVAKALSRNLTVDGVHVKEHKARSIPTVRNELEHATMCAFDKNNNPSKDIIIGTSCHSIESAIRSYELDPRGPDYLFVGTCYVTESHPEKQSSEVLEGPTLPGDVRRALHRMHDDKLNDSKDGNASCSPPSGAMTPPPVVFAIGGIDERNCREPVVLGADGVATIRAAMRSSNPGGTARRMKEAMRAVYTVK